MTDEYEHGEVILPAVAWKWRREPSAAVAGDGIAKVSGRYDGKRYVLAVTWADARASALEVAVLELGEDEAQALGAWLSHGARDDHLQRQLDRRFHPEG